MPSSKLGLQAIYSEETNHSRKWPGCGMYSSYSILIVSPGWKVCTTSPRALEVPETPQGGDLIVELPYRVSCETMCTCALATGPKQSDSKTAHAKERSDILGLVFIGIRVDSRSCKLRV